MTENKRFVETISTGIITDTVTGKGYNCEYRVSNEFLELINQLADENEQLKEENQELTQKKNDLKDLLVNSEPVLEQKELQKIIYKMVYATIDDKINELEKKYEFGRTKVQNCPMFNIRFGIHILEELKKEFSYD